MSSEAAASPKWQTRIGAFTTLPGNMLDLVGISLFLNLLGLALPVALLHVYDRIIPNQSGETLALLILGVVTALVLEAFLNQGRSHITGWVGARFEHIAGCAALERLIFANINDYERDGAGVHMERLAALAQVKEFYAGQAIIAVLDLPFIVLYLGIIAFLGGWLVMAPIAILIVFASAAFWYGRSLKKSLKDRMVADERRFNFIIEVLGGIHTVKSMAMEALMLRRYERLQESSAEGEHRVALHSAQASAIASIFAQVTTVVLVFFGAMLVIEGKMTIGGLSACTLLAGRAMQPLQKALGLWTRFQTIRLARERLDEIFQLEPEALPGMPSLPHLQGRIVMENVAFQYRKDLPKVLHGLNLVLEPGDCIGVAGGNGSGKSTFLSLILGALRPTEGRVLADGYDLKEYDPRSIKPHIAYLPQNGTLFQGTLLENITMFRPEYSEDAQLIAGALGLDDVVANLPLGYETKVGDGAYDSLPRGIRQRIAIARALMSNPQIVLFDEANTAVDGSGDNYLKNCLDQMKGKRTMVLVTHRPSLLDMCDRIYDLKDGTLTLRPPKPPLALPPPGGGGKP